MTATPAPSGGPPIQAPQADGTVTAAQPAGGGSLDRQREVDWAALFQRLGAPLALVVVLLIGAFSFKGFFTTLNLQNIALQSSFIGLITVGQTLVLITGGFDLSVGSMIAVAGVLGALMVGAWGPLGIIGPVAVGLAYGLVNGLLIAKARMAPFIVTLAGLLGLHGVALALAHDNAIRFSGHRDFTRIATGQIAGVDIPVIILVVVFVAGAVFLNRTRFGTGVFAIGGNEESARMMGVAVDRTKILVYVISGGLAGLSGALLAAQLHSGLPTTGNGYELQSIAAAVVGGTLLTGGVGTMSGALAGVLLLGSIQNLINQVGTLSSFTQQLVQGIFIIVVVAIQRFLTVRRRHRVT